MVLLDLVWELNRLLWLLCGMLLRFLVFELVLWCCGVMLLF